MKEQPKVGETYQVYGVIDVTGVEESPITGCLMVKGRMGEDYVCIPASQLKEIWAAEEDMPIVGKDGSV